MRDGEQASKQYSSRVSVLIPAYRCLPCLSSCLGYSQRWAVQWKCKQNKPFLPQVNFGHSLYDSNVKPRQGSKALPHPIHIYDWSPMFINYSFHHSLLPNNLLVMPPHLKKDFLLSIGFCATNKINRVFEVHTDMFYFPCILIFSEPLFSSTLIDSFMSTALILSLFNAFSLLAFKLKPPQLFIVLLYHPLVSP